MNKFQFKAIDKNTAEIYLYGFIGEFMGIGAGEFAEQLQELSKEYKTINVRINSGGGSIFEGIAIYNLIKQSKCEINTYIDGIAASMASVITLAGKKIYMSKYARLMIHRPSGFADGDSETLVEYAKQMDTLEKDLVSIYAQRTGMSEGEVKSQYMKRGIDKWFTAQEAILEKLCDEIYDGPVVTIPADASKTAKAKEMWNSYKQININQNQNEMKNLAMLIALFAMDSTSTEEQIVARMQKEFNDHKIAKKTINDLEAKLKTFEDKAKADHENRVKNLVEKAVTDGKITADLKDSYTAMATANFDAAEKALNAMKAYNPVHGQLKAGEAQQTDERVKWSFVDWQKNDPKGLAEMKEKEVDKFKALFKAQYKSDFKA